MAKAYLYVTSGKKLSKDGEQEIRDKLAGKKFEVALSADVLDDNRKVSDSAAVEKSIMKVLTKAAPALVHAQKFKFNPSAKEMGDCKLTIETESQKTFDCILTLDAPEKIKEKAGYFAIDPLYGKASFGSVLGIRTLKAMLTYTVRHPSPPEVIKALGTAVRKLETDVVKEAEKSINDTVDELEKGLKAEGTKAMSWKAAKELVENLNKDMQRILSSIGPQAEAELGKAAEGLKATVKCSVVAMNSKFQVLGHIKFAGGGAPSANEKSIKPLLSAVQEVDARAKKLDATVAKLVEVADTFYAAQQRAEKELQEAPGPEGGRSQEGDGEKGGKKSKGSDVSREDMKEVAARIEKQLGGHFKNLEKSISDASKVFDEEFNNTDKLVDLLEKMKKVHNKEKSDVKTAEDKKEHAGLARQLEMVSKKGEEFISTLKDCMGQCEQLEKYAQPPACFRGDMARKIQDTASTLEGKQFALVTKKLKTLCADAVAMMEE